MTVGAQFPMIIGQFWHCTIPQRKMKLGVMAVAQEKPVLQFTWTSVRYGRVKIPAGNEPVSKLQARCSSCRKVIAPMHCGIVPVIAFVSMYR